MNKTLREQVVKVARSWTGWLGRGATALTLWLAAALLVLLPGTTPANPAQGPGGPILVVTGPGATFGTYYGEILRTEGFNAFTVADVSTLSASTLAAYDVVLLSKVALSNAQVTVLSDWVSGGGNLIAMAPDAKLATLLGLTPSGTTLSEGYIQVDTTQSPGNGIVGETMQFHGTADRYTLNGATAVARLFSNASTATTSPAVSLRTVGLGRAAAFSYDLATSIVYTRQGNPAWAAQERDGYAPIRSDDKFYGAKDGDLKPDWVDLSKVAIPQADEQQRLLANLILHMNQSRKPLPRFWYFPHGKKAVVIMTGDDHANGGTIGTWNTFLAESPAGCSVADWECIRGTSYIFTNTPMSDAQAAQYEAQGFEVGLHINTGCADYTPTSLANNYALQIPEWQAKYGSVPAPSTMRHHCIAWSDWTTAAQVQLLNGIRLDTSYYYWPPSWANNTPGVFTGSAMPMRFAALDGTLIDVYQAATQMTDESGQSYPYTPDTLLDRAIGAEGYYGAYVVNAHTDVADIIEATATVASAKARGVPVISSRQMLTWLDARNASSFGAMSWNGSALSFTVTKAASARGLQGMLPARFGNLLLSGLTRGGAAVPTTVDTIKGVAYAFFAADSGSYVATYAVDSTPPTVTATSPASLATSVPVTSTVTATFSEAVDPATVSAATVELRSAAGALVSASIRYDALTRQARLTPSTILAAQTTYTATIRGGASGARVADLSGNPLPANVTWTFTTGDAIVTAWLPTVVPANPAEADPGSVEVGVKFRTDTTGLVTGIRFYKGAGNSGVHVGNLWTSGGQLLASATFTGETTTGWQQVNFASPVQISANTVYVASYFAPNGRYASDAGYFAVNGVSRPPVHLLRDGESGGNGVYAYSSVSTFPTESYASSNYYVDVTFVPAPDTLPPAVVSSVPPDGSTQVNRSTSIVVGFDEALDPASVSGSALELLGPGGTAVPASLSYNASTREVTLTPSALLAASTNYTARLRSGAAGVADVAGNRRTADLTWSFTTGTGGTGCAAPANAVVAENCLAGSPASEWDIVGVGDPSIQGFATEISVNKGSTVSFKVDTNATNYRFDIYRMGYYGGLGARKVATVLPSATLPQTQPNCLSQPTTGLVDCGNWAVSGSWSVPATAVSGIYFAKVVRTDTGGASHIVFVVRDDASTSDLLFQTSDTTWQAYNSWGGNSLYTGQPVGRAYKVSYNRPFNTRVVDGGQDWVFNSEYPMVRWLERNGYHVSYTTGVDSDRRGAMIRNHKVFLSVGHDEYWSGAQRGNVEAARNAGVNLAFFSGNEIFWKHRWETSIDGSGTPYRTLVTYKETLASAKIDPNAAWTGTWRDPRFSPPADGGRPENALTGTMFTVNTGTRSIVVPAEEGKLRLWRNTSIASLAAGQSATLPNGTLGYEWDSDVDNGSRPPGLIRLSNTTATGVDVLQDYGSTYASGTANHALTMYRHASGARVFSAGTIQWSWGLDATHDRAGAPADSRMQQASVNLFADMGVQAPNLQSGLVQAFASTDSTAPVSTITSPTSTGFVAGGSTVTITGTATDNGGAVGGVEVSVDGGTTWRAATGRAAWTFNWTAPAAGTVVTIRTRAVDDSGNIEAPAAGVTLTVGTLPPCPCTIWPATAVPQIASDPSSSAVTVGVKFRAATSGYITGIRFYKGAGNTGTHVGSLWTSGGQLLGQATFVNETASGWQQVNFATPVAVSAGTTYVASYFAPNGRYAIDQNYFASSGVNSGRLEAPSNASAGGNGVYALGSSPTFPSSTWNASNYWVDVVFSTTIPADTTAPAVTSTTPAAGATNVSPSSAVTVAFSEPMNATTIGTSSIELRDAGGALVAATVTYASGMQTATLTPSAALAGGVTYTVTVRGGAVANAVRDVAGNPLAANVTWSFTTTAPIVCPCTIWPNTATPDVPSAADSSVNLGVKFRAETSGYITGIRYYKGAGNTGTHVGSLWSASGQLLARATFTGETASGWQQVNFAAPVAVTANTVYVASYLAPNGGYAVSGSYFAANGAGTGPVKALSSAEGGGNGVYAYGSTSIFPTGTWNATNYWVDVVFSTTLPADTTPPTVTSVMPASGATNVSPSTTVAVTFSEPMNAGTIGTSSIELRTAGGALVASTVSYAAGTQTATLTPTAALAGGTTYTVTVRGGTGANTVKDVAGNALAANATWSFTTTTPIVCPCTIWPDTATPDLPSAADSSVNLGVKFRSDISGYITGIRFYKGAGNTGTHVGSLWSASGQLLAQATFTGETASGWQQVSFATPVAIAANTVYVASYLAPNGGYAFSGSYFSANGAGTGPVKALSSAEGGGNGVFGYGTTSLFPTGSWNAGNYWVDVVFSTTP